MAVVWETAFPDKRNARVGGFSRRGESVVKKDKAYTRVQARAEPGGHKKKKKNFAEATPEKATTLKEGGGVHDRGGGSCGTFNGRARSSTVWKTTRNSRQQ